MPTMWSEFWDIKSNLLVCKLYRMGLVGILTFFWFFLVKVYTVDICLFSVQKISLNFMCGPRASVTIVFFMSSFLKIQKQKFLIIFFLSYLSLSFFLSFRAIIVLISTFYQKKKIS